MNMDDKYFEPKPIDNVTDYGRGIAPKIDNRTDAGRGYPKPIDNVTDYGRGIAPEIDNRTDAGRGYPKPIDNRTDYGRGIIYKTCDGKDVATMEEVMIYNQMYYDRMMNKTENNYIESTRMHR